MLMVNVGGARSPVSVLIPVELIVTASMLRPEKLIFEPAPERVIVPVPLLQVVVDDMLTAPAIVMFLLLVASSHVLVPVVVSVPST